MIQQNCACPFLQAWLHWLLNEISWTLEHLALFVQGDYTRTGERKLTGMMKDGVNSANRYLNSLSGHITVGLAWCSSLPVLLMGTVDITWACCPHFLSLIEFLSFFTEILMKVKKDKGWKMIWRFVQGCWIMLCNIGDSIVVCPNFQNATVSELQWLKFINETACIHLSFSFWSSWLNRCNL